MGIYNVFAVCHSVVNVIRLNDQSKNWLIQCEVKWSIFPSVELVCSSDFKHTCPCVTGGLSLRFSLPSASLRPEFWLPAPSSVFPVTGWLRWQSEQRQKWLLPRREIHPPLARWYTPSVSPGCVWKDRTCQRWGRSASVTPLSAVHTATVLYLTCLD